jgi:hypothetical protein
LSIEDKIPDHSAFSRARHERFRDSDMFRRVFERVVEACIAAGLVGGEGFAVDDCCGRSWCASFSSRRYRRFRCTGSLTNLFVAYRFRRPVAPSGAPVGRAAIRWSGARPPDRVVGSRLGDRPDGAEATARHPTVAQPRSSPVDDRAYVPPLRRPQYRPRGGRCGPHRPAQEQSASVRWPAAKLVQVMPRPEQASRRGQGLSARCRGGRLAY